MKLSILGSRLAVCRLAPDAEAPAWVRGSAFWSVTRTDDELSVICEGNRVPAGVRSEPGWRAIRLAGPLDFSAVGVLAPIAAELAEAGIAILALATFDTDYVLVQDAHLDRARRRLEAAGHRFDD